MSTLLQCIDDCLQYVDMCTEPWPEKGYNSAKYRLNVIARVLLLAVYDDTHIFSKFRGMRYIVKAIWEYALDFNRQHFESAIQIGYYNNVFVLKKCPITFPKPTAININMMPFINSRDFKKTKLPQCLKQYFKLLILPCIQSTDKDFNNIRYHMQNDIFFLTIQESVVDVGKTQRRPGLHTESPGNTEEGYQIMWGGGEGFTWNYDSHGGLFMASSVAKSCAVWDCKIIKHRNSDSDIFDSDSDSDTEVIGHLGNIEHLRTCIPNTTMTYVYDDAKQMEVEYEKPVKHIMDSNCLYWLTDRTPHEALANYQDVIYRQFFRLVTTDVSVWYEEHSTKNPNGVMPDPNITKIIKGSKFHD